MQAAILNHKLKNFPQEILRRRRIAEIYHEGLKDCEGVIYTPFFKDDEQNFDIFQNFEICCKKRDLLKDFLFQNNIKTIVQWAGMPVHDSNLDGINKQSILPETDIFFKDCLFL